MALYPVINYGASRWVVHYAKGRLPKDFLGNEVNPEPGVKAEEWWYWRSLCGKDLIARVTESHPVDCQTCLKAYEKGQRQAAELVERFG